MVQITKNANEEVGKYKESVEHCIALIKSVKKKYCYCSRVKKFTK